VLEAGKLLGVGNLAAIELPFYIRYFGEKVGYLGFGFPVLVSEFFQLLLPGIKLFLRCIQNLPVSQLALFRVELLKLKELSGYCHFSGDYFITEGA
jgi:hypothetical protein